MQEPPSVTLILWVSQQIIIHENFTTKLQFWYSTTSEQMRNCRNYVSTRDRVYKGRAVENGYFLSTLNSYKPPLHVGETPFDWNESAVTTDMARSTRMQQNISLFTLLPKFTFHDFTVKTSLNMRSCFILRSGDVFGLKIYQSNRPHCIVYFYFDQFRWTAYRDLLSVV